jgi:hypothetical protein
MRLLIAAFFVALAMPAFASCAPPVAVGSVPEQIDNQTAALICQQGELKAVSDAQSRQLQIEAELQQQRIMLEQELKIQQQLVALNAQTP